MMPIHSYDPYDRTLARELDWGALASSLAPGLSENRLLVIRAMEGTGARSLAFRLAMAVDCLYAISIDPTSLRLEVFGYTNQDERIETVLEIPNPFQEHPDLVSQMLTQSLPRHGLVISDVSLSSEAPVDWLRQCWNGLLVLIERENINDGAEIGEASGHPINTYEHRLTSSDLGRFWRSRWFDSVGAVSDSWVASSGLRLLEAGVGTFSRLDEAALWLRSRLEGCDPGKRLEEVARERLLDYLLALYRLQEFGMRDLDELSQFLAKPETLLDLRLQPWSLRSWSDGLGVFSGPLRQDVDLLRVIEASRSLSLLKHLYSRFGPARDEVEIRGQSLRSLYSEFKVDAEKRVRDWKDCLNVWWGNRLRELGVRSILDLSSAENYLVSTEELGSHGMVVTLLRVFTSVHDAARRLGLIADRKLRSDLDFEIISFIHSYMFDISVMRSIALGVDHKFELKYQRLACSLLGSMGIELRAEDRAAITTVCGKDLASRVFARNAELSFAAEE